MAEKCSLCPRKCNVDRAQHKGYCKAGKNIRAAKAYLHQWEEPCISGNDKSRGSGTIFFSDCQLKCPFCQNYEISHIGAGKSISTQKLCEIMLSLQSDGAYNINLVSPTPYLAKIAEAIDICGSRLKIPIAMNSGGYESEKSIAKYCNNYKIFMPDIKFFSSGLSAKYLNASDYFERAVEALEAMLKIVGKPTFDDNGMLVSGVLVRHLVMPGHYHDSLKILQALFDRFGCNSFILSLMSQYMPCFEAKKYPEINRKLTTFEYEKVTDFAAALGFSGYSQQRSSANADFIPKWDFQGIL